MPSFNIIQYDPHFFSQVPAITLRQRSIAVEKFDETLARLADAMVQIINELGRGTGLAAPQIGVLYRVILINVQAPRSRYSIKPPDPERDAAFQPVTALLVNPEIAYRSPEENLDREGCFSLPGYIGLVKRASRIEVQARDVRGGTVSLVAEGHVARVIQHEIDHLDGILYVDRMAAGERLIPKAELDPALK